MPSDMLHAALITPLEGLLNQLLATDSVTGDALGRLAGNIIKIEANDIAQSLFILPYQGGVQLQLDCEAPADVTLSGSSSKLLQLLTSQNKAEHFFGNGITVEGKTSLANQFQGLLADSQIDFEGLLAEYIGDLPAHYLSDIVRSKNHFLALAAKSFGLNSKEYIQEELNILPTQPEFEGWAIDVEGVSETTDRLAARIQRLERRISSIKKA